MQDIYCTGWVVQQISVTFLLHTLITLHITVILVHDFVGHHFESYRVTTTADLAIQNDDPYDNIYKKTTEEASCFEDRE